MTALGHSAGCVSADHPGYHFGLALVRGQHVDCFVEPAFGALNFNTGHGGVEDVGQILDKFAGT